MKESRSAMRPVYVGTASGLVRLTGLAVPAPCRRRSQTPGRRVARSIGCMPVKLPKAGSTADPLAERGSTAGAAGRGRGHPAPRRDAGGRPARRRRPRLRVVAQRQAACDQRLVDHGEAQRGGRVAGAVVVVAAHQRQFNPACRSRQRGHGGQRGRRMRARAECRKSPRKTMRCACVLLHQRAQPIERLARRATRHRHAQAHESSPPCRCGHRRSAGCGCAATRPPSEEAAAACRRQVASSPRARSRESAAAQGVLRTPQTSRFSAASRCSVGLRLKPERA